LNFKNKCKMAKIANIILNKKVRVTYLLK